MKTIVRRKVVCCCVFLLIAVIFATPTNAVIDLTGTWHPECEGGGGGGDSWFNSSAAYYVTSSLMSNWNDSYSWGNHALQNYLDLDTYPNTDTDSTDDFDGVWSSLTGVPAGFADGIDNEGSSPGGNDGQIQYNNSGSLDGAYYYKNGNMTSSLDGTWGYYEDDTMIVIGNLSYVSIYKD